MLKRAESVGITTLPSSAALPIAHVIFKWNTLDTIKEEVKAHRHPPALALSPGSQRSPQRKRNNKVG